MFWLQLRNELYKMFARKRTYIGFGAFIFAQSLILLLLHLPKAKKGILREINVAKVFLVDAESYFGGLTLAVLVIVISFTLLAGLYIALVSGDIVAKEHEDGTLRMILCRPVSRLRLLVLKWAAGLIYTAVLVGFMALFALTIATLYRGELGRLFIMVPHENIRVGYDTMEGLGRYVIAAGCLMFSALVISSVAFMFSCFRMKPAAATILTLSVFFVDLVLRQMPYLESYRHYFITHHTASWARTFAKEPDWIDIGGSWLYLLAIHAVCFVIGAAAFIRRDIKS
jgi:ABC-2 type transport system permease protein